MQVKVSIVIPVYNAELFLDKCIVSVLNQTLKELEIICVNDGSSDSSLEILQKYEKIDSRIRVVTQANSGGGVARNNGLSKAVGEYVYFLDADDYLDINAMEVLYRYAKEKRLDIVLFEAMCFSDASMEQKRMGSVVTHKYLPQKEVFSVEDIPDKIFNVAYGYVWTKLYRLDFVKKHKIQFQDIRITDAMAFVYEAMVLANRIGYMNEVFIHYRMEEGMGQSFSSSKYPLNVCYSWMELKKRLVALGIYEKVKQSFVNRAADHCVGRLELLNTKESFCLLYNKLKTIYFKELDIEDKTEEYFFDKNVYIRYIAVRDKTIEEYLFDKVFVMKRSKSRGVQIFSPYVFPIELIEAGSRVVIYGGGNVGRAYYIQAINSRHCDIVAWVDKNYNNMIKQITSVEDVRMLEYDYIVIAIENEHVVLEVKSELLQLGFDETKIIWRSPKK